MSFHTFFDTATTLNIFRLFSKHTQQDGAGGPVPYEGVAAQKIQQFWASQKPISLLLPAFPWKSPNPQKTLSQCPDLGEELGLIRLNHLCNELAQVFPYGAQIAVVSDGTVYNDLLGYPDEDVFNYGKELRDMALKNSLDSITFLRLVDVLGIADSKSMSKESLLDITATCRSELEKRFLDPDFSIEMEIKHHSDTALTYEGFVKGAYDDLRWGSDTPEVVISNAGLYQAEAQRVAKQMTRRLIAYEKALESRFPDSIRLSIHPSSGKSKFSVPLVPQPDCFGLTPWHSCLLVTARGCYRTTWRKDVTDPEAYEVVSRNGIPYFVREAASY
ncbi:hypothetical protein LZ31DRAFT_569874 [Colletotrichum somersetense]|nr:hypothetical protein LZ31DRAFT_569874 [Colletotrichum somersetense]